MKNQTNDFISFEENYKRQSIENYYSATPGPVPTPDYTPTPEPGVYFLSYSPEDLNGNYRNVIKTTYATIPYSIYAAMKFQLTSSFKYIGTDSPNVSISGKTLSYNNIRSIYVREEGFILLDGYGSIIKELEPGENYNLGNNVREFYIVSTRKFDITPSVRLVVNYDAPRSFSAENEESRKFNLIEE